MENECDIEEYCYAVIGGGIAGVTCAEHLYILDPEQSTALITPSPLVKAVTNVLTLTKTLDIFDVKEQTSENLECQCPNVTVLKGYVSRLDASQKIIHISTGKKLRYQKLCICTGGQPKVISENNPFVLSIRDTESVQQFQSRINKAKRIVIVGNGGIATEMVYEITGLDIIWAIKDKHMNATFMDPGAAEFFRPQLETSKPEPSPSAPVKRRKYTIDGAQFKHVQVNDGKEVLLGGALGPDWHTGIQLGGDLQHRVTVEAEVEIVAVLTPSQVAESKKSVTKLKGEEEGEWPVYIELSNGKLYGCDFIVSATGVVPNTSFITEGNNFELCENGGILVDESLVTSEEHVYAAGDVCTPRWTAAKHWFQMRLWTQARQMGSYAAKCMWACLINEEIYMDFCFEIFTHGTRFFGHKVILLGLFNGQKLDKKYDILLRVTKGCEYVKCIMEDGKMQGALLIGETNLEETFENLILNQMDLSIYGEDLLDPDIDIEDYFD